MDQPPIRRITDTEWGVSVRVEQICADFLGDTGHAGTVTIGSAATPLLTAIDHCTGHERFAETLREVAAEAELVFASALADGRSVLREDHPAIVADMVRLHADVRRSQRLPAAISEVLGEYLGASEPDLVTVQEWVIGLLDGPFGAEIHTASPQQYLALVELAYCPHDADWSPLAVAALQPSL